MQYEILIDGHLGPRWASWFEGFTTAHGPDGTTVLRGQVADQSALHGLLQTLRDLGIPLRSLAPVDHPADEGDPPVPEGVPNR